MAEFLSFAAGLILGAILCGLYIRARFVRSAEARILAENDELRRRMDELADAMLAEHARRPPSP